MKKFLITICAALFLAFGIDTGALAASNSYTVKSGDTLYRIAKTYKISLKDLKQWNHLTSDIIHPKQKLVISKVSSSTTYKSQSTTQKTSAAKAITVSASAYTANCKGCSGITAIGINLKKNPNQKVISVDPSVIPLGTKVYVEGYGYAIAADKGSGIKGNKIDVFIPNKKEALKWGRKTVKVTFLNK